MGQQNVAKITFQLEYTKCYAMQSKYCAPYPKLRYRRRECWWVRSALSMPHRDMTHHRRVQFRRRGHPVRRPARHHRPLASRSSAPSPPGYRSSGPSDLPSGPEDPVNMQANEQIYNL